MKRKIKIGILLVGLFTLLPRNTMAEEWKELSEESEMETETESEVNVDLYIEETESAETELVLSPEEETEVISNGTYLLEKDGNTSTYLSEATNFTCPLGGEHALEYVSAKERTCSESGRIAGYICTKCGTAYSGGLEIPATGLHSYIDYQLTDQDTEATCSDYGTETKMCKECGLERKRKTKKQEHIEVIDQAIEPDCEHWGKTEGSHCSVCGKVLKEQIAIAPTGHAYGICDTDEVYGKNGMEEVQKCLKCGQEKH